MASRGLEEYTELNRATLAIAGSMVCFSLSVECVYGEVNKVLERSHDQKTMKIMIIKKTVVLILVLSGFFNVLVAQTPPIERYVVFTFEDTYKISGEGTESYYWIILQDSIKSNDSQVYHLFLNSFSKNNVDDCCNGKDIDPGTHFPNTSYGFSSEYNKSLDQLDSIILKHRKKLQTIVKVWSTGQNEKIEVFATSVSGKFCSSNFHKFGQEKWGYKGKVYIPLSSFSYLGEFWDSDQAKFILHEDFSKINFKIIPYYIGLKTKCIKI